MEKETEWGKSIPALLQKGLETTYHVNVHFAEDTTDTVADKLLHLMGTVALTDEISSATDEAEAV